MKRDDLELGLLLEIESRALQAPTAQALRFTLVNETHALAPYRQAALFERSRGRWRLTAASGLASIAKDSPYAVWLEGFVRSIAPTSQHNVEPHRLSMTEASPAHAEGWAEWLPEHLLLLPLPDTGAQAQALALYARDDEWTDTDVQLLDRLHMAFGRSLAALTRSRSSSTVAARLGMQRKAAWVVAALAVAAMALPVRLSVLAPAEVVALDSLAVSAPLDGVVSRVAVQPNARVKAGDLLFALDDSTVANRRQVALKSLELARVDAHIAQQRAFDDAKSKAELGLALGRVREKEAELAAIDVQAQRGEVRAERDGIAIFADVNDWIGKPLMTGQRVMQLAQPSDAGIQVWLGVSDAINLELGSPVRLFLHTDPLAPRAGRLVETSYQAGTSPENVAAYKLKARFDDGSNGNNDANSNGNANSNSNGSDIPRIGLRGTARLTGDSVPLAYYLFRRPIATLREWTGL